MPWAIETIEATQHPERGYPHVFYPAFDYADAQQRMKATRGLAKARIIMVKDHEWTSIMLSRWDGYLSQPTYPSPEGFKQNYLTTVRHIADERRRKLRKLK